MKAKSRKHRWFCILMVALLMVSAMPTHAMAEGEQIHLRGISTLHLDESGEIGLSVCATNDIGEGVSIKPSDLQVQINGQEVESQIDHNSKVRHVFVVDYSLSVEKIRWTYATEATAGLISGLLSQNDKTEDVTVVWVGDDNQIETVAAESMETIYRAKREETGSDMARIYDGIDQAIEYANSETDGYDYYNIYVLTDGLDTGSRATLDHLTKKIKDGNSPISLFVCTIYNGSRAMEMRTVAETARKTLERFTTNLDGIYDSLDIQKTGRVEENVKRALNKYSNANYGLMNVRISLNGVSLDRKNGQTEVYVGLASGSNAKRKTIYLPVDKLPMQVETSETQDLNAIIQEKEAQIATLISDAAIKDAEMNALQKTNEELTAKAELLETKNAEKEATIENLNENIAKKDEEIKRLEGEKTKADTQIKALEENTTEQASKIETLEADTIEKAKSIDMLTADVAEKETTIERLETDKAEQASKIETLETDNADKDTQITTLATELSAKLNEIGSLQASVKEHETIIESQKTTIAEEESQIEALESSILEKESQIEKMNAKDRAQSAQLLIYKKKILEEGKLAGYEGTDSLQVIVPTRDYIVERLSMVSDVESVAAVTVDNDPNGQLGKEGQYIEQIYFSSPLVNPDYAGNSELDVISAGTACGGSIEVYRTISDAMERNNHLAYYDDSSSNTGSHTVVGTLVIRTSSSLSLVDQRKLEEEIIDALISE